jgi:hypothetical protein
MSRSLGGATLLIAALAGCGSGGEATAGNASPNAVAAVDEAGAAAPKSKAPVPAGPKMPKIDPSLIPEPGAPLVRETYSYVGGNRDPFLSVLEGANIGPELTDLDLVIIVYQERSPSASVAVLRDRATGKRYTLREGDRAGRARVSNIGPKDVTFTFDDYGTQRQVSLTLRKAGGTTP